MEIGFWTTVKSLYLSSLKSRTAPAAGNHRRNFGKWAHHAKSMILIDPRKHLEINLQKKTTPCNIQQPLLNFNFQLPLKPNVNIYYIYYIYIYIECWPLIDKSPPRKPLFLNKISTTVLYWEYKIEIERGKEKGMKRKGKGKLRERKWKERKRKRKEPAKMRKDKEADKMSKVPKWKGPGLKGLCGGGCCACCFLISLFFWTGLKVRFSETEPNKSGFGDEKN